MKGNVFSVSPSSASKVTGVFNGNLTRVYWNAALEVNFSRNDLKSSPACAASLSAFALELLLADDGETEKTFPCTKEKWPLLDSETLREERITQEEGGVYVSKFTLNEPAHKVFEAGYEESEVDLRVEFELLPDGKWYVVDCYTGWYGYDLPIAELKQTIQHVQEENAAFKELHP